MWFKYSKIRSGPIFRVVTVADAEAEDEAETEGGEGVGGEGGEGLGFRV